MARRSNVPKFGEWENQSNVPYTAYFDKARKNKGNDPNIPAQFPEQERRVQRGAPPAPAPAPAPTPVAPRPNRPAEPAYDQPRGGRVRSTGGNRTDPPEVPRRTGNEVPKARPRGEHGVGVDASPLHRNQPHGRGGSGGVERGFNNGASPLHQGSSGHGLAPGPQGRGRKVQGLRSIHDPDDSAVPKFGDWEDSENITEKFNKVLKERQNGPAVSPGPAYNKPVIKVPKKKGFLCFSWLSK